MIEHGQHENFQGIRSLNLKLAWKAETSLLQTLGFVMDGIKRYKGFPIHF